MQFFHSSSNIVLEHWFHQRFCSIERFKLVDIEFGFFNPINGHIYKSSMTYLIHGNYTTRHMKVEMLICSNLWNGVDESEINLSPNDPTIQLTWKDSKAHASIFSHCGKKSLIF
jgi:hypothetical protein